MSGLGNLLLLWGVIFTSFEHSVEYRKVEADKIQDVHYLGASSNNEFARS